VPSETVSKLPNPDGDLVCASGLTFSSACDAFVQRAEKAKSVSQDGRIRATTAPRRREAGEAQRRRHENWPRRLGPLARHFRTKLGTPVGAASPPITNRSSTVSAAEYADFRIIDFHLVNDRADGGAAEGRISGHASWDRATFSNSSGFDRATFSDDASVSPATFLTKVSFNSSKFFRSAKFDSSTFSDIASFDSATRRSAVLWVVSVLDGALRSWADL
jgi:hypothetical protein